MRGSPVVAAALVLVAAGCSSSAALRRELADTTKERDALRAEKAELARQVAETRAALAKAAKATTLPVPVPAPAPAAAIPSPAPAAETPPAPPPAADPFRAAKAWVADAIQLRDVKKRDAALAAIRDALAGNDADRAAAALVAVPQIANVKYDKAPLHDLVLRHAKSADTAARAAVPFALLNADGPRPGDLDVVLALSADWAAQVRDSAGRSLVFFTKYELTGPAGERVLALLDDPDKQVRRDVLASIWGAKISPAIEAKLLDRFRSEDPQVRHDAFYFGLSTLKEKSPAVVDTCIAAMESADSEMQWRARWGLAQGVPQEQRGKVGDAYVRLLWAPSDAQFEEDSLQWLRRYGTDAHAAELVKLAQSPLVADSTKLSALDAAVAIRSRESR